MDIRNHAMHTHETHIYDRDTVNKSSKHLHTFVYDSIRPISKARLTLRIAATHVSASSGVSEQM